MTVNDSVSLAVVLAILAMSGATYAMRAGGFWLMGYVRMTPRIRRMLEASPGAVIVATVLPIVMREGLPATFAVIVGVAVMLAWRRDYVAVAAGLAIAAAMRAFMP